MSDKLEALKAVAEKYSLTLKAHQHNPRDVDAVDAWDEATEEFSRLINNDEMGIISTLLAELAETYSTLKSVTECWNDEYQRNKELEQRTEAAERALKVEQEQSTYYEKQMWHFHALAEVEAINNAEIERANAAQADHINQQQDRIDTLEKKNDELGKHVSKQEKLLKATEESLIASVDMVAELEQQHPKAKPSIIDVIAERQRQIRKGSDSNHDDGYIDGVLALGGAAYAISGAGMNGVGTYRKRAKNLWPFPLKTFNPAGNAHRREDLIRGAAMIIAEIDKIDRSAVKAKG